MMKIVNLNGRYAPRFFCDACGQHIDNAGNGLVLYTGDRSQIADGADVPHVHVHKGLCDKRAAREHGDNGTDELQTHMVYVLANLGMDADAVTESFENTRMMAEVYG